MPMKQQDDLRHLRLLGLALAATLLAATPLAAMPLAAGPAGAMAGDRPRLRGGYERQLSEHDHALRNRETGQIRSLNELLPRAHRAVGESEFIGVESNNAGLTYRFKFQRPDGRLVWVDMDGRTGSVLSVR